MTELWVCEYSTVQGCYHVDTLEKVLEINRVMVSSGQIPSYIPLGVFETATEAGNFCREWRETHSNEK